MNLVSKLNLNLFLFTFVSIFISLFVLNSFQVKVAQAVAGHVVISEVQVGVTGASTNEFVELYNPTESMIELSGWVLSKKTAAGVDQDLLATFPSSTEIASHGYFLITHADYTGSTSADLAYTTPDSLAANNTIYLKNSSDIIIDKLGLGTTNDFEVSAKGNPPTSGSVERKANFDSTSTSMNIGGTDQFNGNGEDTDNNASDFVNRAVSEPQNSTSTQEPTISSLTPTPPVTPSPSAEPSIEPSVSPSGSPSPSITPSLEPTPSIAPSPSITPSPSPTPSGTPFSRIIGTFAFAKNPKVCYLIYQPVKIASINLMLPKLSCQTI